MSNAEIERLRAALESADADQRQAVREAIRLRDARWVEQLQSGPVRAAAREAGHEGYHEHNQMCRCRTVEHLVVTVVDLALAAAAKTVKP